MPTDAHILALVRDAFAVPRPEHFTNHTHCCECDEHDATLQSRDLDTLTMDEAGSPAWDPITFCTPWAFAYWVPALARLTLELPHDYWGWYGDTLVNQLERDGPRNERWLHCTPAQRAAVVSLLEHIFATRAALIDDYDLLHRFARVVEIWSDQSRD
jgi:hypothetical protein